MNTTDLQDYLHAWKKLGVSHCERDNCISFGESWPTYDYRHYHLIFNPIPEQHVAEYLHYYPWLSGWQYIDIMDKFNGATLFKGGLNLYGFWRRSEGPENEALVLVPFAIEVENAGALVKDELTELVFGSMNIGDTQKNLSETHSGNYLISDRETGVKEAEFPSLEQLVKHCIDVKNEELLDGFSNCI
jgi:hypothetical protein